MERALRHIVQIVPGLAPKVDGIGDYALQLARQLKLRHNIDTHFVVADPSWSSGESEPEFPVSTISERTADAFLETLRQTPASKVETPLLLHVAAYGYEH